MERDPTAKTAERAFERKILRARLAAVFEQVWLKLWLVVAVVAAFLLVSYLDLWSRLPVLVHGVLLGAFAVALAVALVLMARVTWPSREAAIRRIEQASNVPHRPASSYEDTLSAPASDATTRAIWAAHRSRMAALLGRLKPGKPHPRTDRFDPFALRAAALVALVGATGLLGPVAIERVRSAFTFGASAGLAQARLDARLTPPTYTAKPPVMLADGAGGAGSGEAGAQVVYEAPIKSILIVRVGGMGEAPLAIEVVPTQAKGETAPPERVDAKAEAGTGDLKEVRYEMTRSATVRVVSSGREIARWPITVIPDQVPRISLSRPPELTPRGSLKLTYKAEDDYGVVSATADLARVKEAPREDRKAWARAPALKGPRAPLLRLPKLELRLPNANATEQGAHTYFEMASHPWAGRKVIMTLTAKDAAGQVGRSPGFEMVLPEKTFTKPLARAVVEQRKKLMEDSRYRASVVTALDALTLAPEGFIEDTKVYLGLRTARHRLKGDRSRAAYKSVIDQLWQIALRIEDGSLSDAERALKDAQDKLAKALEGGASEEEIKQLMQELRQALNEFLKQLAQESGNPQQEGQNQDQQTLAQQDLERMMQNLEDMAKSGSREQAQQMLSELQDLMERLQSGRQDQAQAERNKEMMKMMEELGDMVGDQQQLMDDTFGERRDGEGEGERGAEAPKPPPGMKGMGSEQNRDGRSAGAPPGQGPAQAQGRGQQRGQPGSEAQQGQGQQLGQGNQSRRGLDDLTRRQGELRDRLGQLQKGLREKGAPSSQQLADAENAMESAEDALKRGDLEEATEQQSRALDQMRQGAQDMAQDMMRNMPQRYGQSGDTPRDPLGRPQRSQGPDLGTSVKVPDQIDVQRAREILEELRRRLGEARRAPVELDYLERLLRRF